MTDDTDKIVASPAPGRVRRGLLGLTPDDVDRALYAGVFVLVALVIAAVGYLVYVVLAPAPAPRTEVERRIAYYENGVKAEPTNARMWALYANALVDAGRYGTAADVIATGLRKVQDDAALLVVRATLERERGQDDRALKTADEAIAAVEASRARLTEQMAAKGSGAPLAPSDERIAAWIIKAEIHTDRREAQKAIEAYGHALEENPRMADVLAARGDLHFELGDDDAARADYQEALRYDPQSKQAADGLTKLGDATR